MLIQTKQDTPTLQNGNLEKARLCRRDAGQGRDWEKPVAKQHIGGSSSCLFPLIEAKKSNADCSKHILPFWVDAYSSESLAVTEKLNSQAGKYTPANVFVCEKLHKCL